MDRGAVALALMGCALVISACGGTHTVPEGDAPAEAGKYDQTWPKDYGSTSCGEWLNQMDDHQRFVAGADMIINLWGVDGVNGELPPDPMVNAFSGDVSQACEANSQIKVNEVGATLYVTAKDQYGPP